MRIKLTLIQKLKKDRGMCIVRGCLKQHGKGMNICYSHKVQRRLSKLSKEDALQLAYKDYCKSQLKYEMGIVTLKEFEEQHSKPRLF